MEPTRFDGSEKRAGDHRTERDLTLLRLVNSVLQHRRLVLLLPLVAMIAIVAISLFIPRQHVATASFMPQQERGQLDRFSGLAARLGFELPADRAAESPEFYVKLLESRRILEIVAGSEYAIENAEGALVNRSLEEYLGPRGATSTERRHRVVERLRKQIQVRADPQTGIVRLRVKDREPSLAEQLATRLLSSVQEFDRETRRSNASAERVFLEGRLAGARGELTAAEDSLERFLRENRRYENSPELLFAYERMQRSVEMRRQVVASLADAYEQARLEEVRNTPLITVIDAPEGSVRPETRYLILRALLAGVLGLLLAVSIAAGSELGRSEPSAEADEYGRFQALRDDVREDVLQAWRRVRSIIIARRAA